MPVRADTRVDHTTHRTPDATIAMRAFAQIWKGALAWAFGELPTLILAILVLIAWMRDDSREARRYDRRADRDGDAELAAYNAYLARLSAGDRDRPTPR